MKRCTESFTIWRDGAPVAFAVGQLVDDKHPILKTHKHLFAEPTASTGQATAAALRPAEQATSEPGEKRTLTPPEQTARQAEDGPKPFDPGEHKAPEVLAYLRDADEEERARVLAAEAAGQKRKGILGDATTA
ncbi:hypothetical protein SCAB_48221 [Streptomyces scabiei 87.22]|uniref:Uncharacterized protein n=1 Tax=Streptomyces scabiei (strain 87.22) TaxID=680198 RepID=C9ZDU9_STRSW|nr:hypothetical protein [Streptomyces scabiei]MDX2892499.1 hypothetical protein [Streptomyces scabiei]MDX2900592.1 hypothetical protein [Streptomyces scabiei]MDX2994124.1 hypothetical protein [Streptomyces scabiei]MDX3084766.1 hypothetical protein [Streptomyces scabiei]MDX3137894.1 hypothetical protein [Streptomyces scabiei]